MTRRNALMEWMDQIRKLGKSKDYILLDTIDSIFDVLWAVDFKVLSKYKEVLDDVCERYHKPNPLDYDHGRVKSEKYYLQKNGEPIQVSVSRKLKKQFKGKPPEQCFGNRDWRSCGLAQFGIGLLSKYVDENLERCTRIQKDVLLQWAEVIDFMWERPELINPAAVDEYVKERINYVCRKMRKNNPLLNGIKEKFGKEYFGDDNKWHRERRMRF